MTKAPNKRLLGLALSTALTSVALAGCSSTSANSSAYSAAHGESAVIKGHNEQAIAYAETAVQSDPRNADYRALLGSAYLDGGRFNSAAQAYAEAIDLGDNTARTALGFTLAAIGAGRQDEALDTLREWEGVMDAGDFGLALALAGRPAQGAHMLGNAIRNGQNTAKVRQNLAYAYALAGDWRSARVMAAEDVPADQLGARLGTWAETSAPEFYQQRVARLLGTAMVRDSGMPTYLALANYPEEVRMASAEAETPILDVAAVEEAPAPEQLAEAEPAPAPVAPAQNYKVAANGQRYVSNPVVQQLPARKTEAAPRRQPTRIAKAEPAAPKAKAPVKIASGDHRIQLGSFTSLDGAERAKSIYAKKYPQLDASSFSVARAEVNGKTYYRVSAGGMAESSAASMCSSIKSSGGGCFAYAGARKLPGTVERDVRVAVR